MKVRWFISVGAAFTLAVGTVACSSEDDGGDDPSHEGGAGDPEGGEPTGQTSGTAGPPGPSGTGGPSPSASTSSGTSGPTGNPPATTSGTTPSSPGSGPFTGGSSTSTGGEPAPAGPPYGACPVRHAGPCNAGEACLSIADLGGVGYSWCAAHCAGAGDPSTCPDPETGTAVPVCIMVNEKYPMCGLECTGGETCPDGMECVTPPEDDTDGGDTDGGGPDGTGTDGGDEPVQSLCLHPD